MPKRVTRAGMHAPKEWDTAELNRLLASARSMPGDVGDIPARLWFPALLLTTLDTIASPRELLAAPQAAYNHTHGTLALGLLIYELHPPALEAIDTIRRHDHAELFPWPWDNPAGPHFMLYRRMKELLYRAGLPYNRTALFERLRVTARRRPDVLGEIGLSQPAALREGKPRLPRARDKRRWTEPIPHPGIPSPAVTVSAETVRAPEPDLVRLSPAHHERLLSTFLEETYIPLRMADCVEASIAGHRMAVDKFSWFLGSEATFAHFTDDHLERFLPWLKATGSRENVTLQQIHCLSVGALAVRLEKESRRRTAARRQEAENLQAGAQGVDIGRTWPHPPRGG